MVFKLCSFFLLVNEGKLASYYGLYLLQINSALTDTLHENTGVMNTCTYNFAQGMEEAHT